MSGNPYLHLRHAGMLLCSALLASTPDFAQHAVRSAEPPQSIISLASAPRPKGELLARNPGESTFVQAPANYHVFAAARVGEDVGVEALTLNFAGETTLTRIESRNKDFVVESGGTCHEGNRYAHGNSCVLLVRFNPQGPGHRLGFITVTHSAEAKPMSLGLVGNGYAPVVSFTPSEITTIAATYASSAGTIKSSTNLAIDGGDIVYITDTGNDLIKKIDSSGTITTVTPAFATPASVAVDSLGILYSANVSGSTYYFSDFTPWGVQTAFGYTYVSSTCTASAPCAFSAVGMGSPANMSIDAYDNLFFEEGTTGAAEMPVASLGQGTGTLQLWHLKDQYSYASGSAGSFAADAGGNIYTDYTYTPNSTCFLIEEPLYNAEYSPTANRVAGGTKCGFSGDGGQARSAEISSSIGQIAFDVAGNLYFADAGNQRVRMINAQTGIISTIAGTGTAGYSGDGNQATSATLSNPTGITVDSQGQVYILSSAPSGAATQVLRKIGVNGYWYYGSVIRSTATPAKVFTVANTGNEALTLTGAPVFTGVSDFSIDPVTTTCAITAGSTLNAGASCQIGIIFKPSTTGSRTANLVLHDNTVTNTNIIQLVGNGVLPTPTMKITAPASGSSVTVGTAVTFTATVTSTSSPAPTGTVTFSVNGTTIGSAVTLSSGTASTTFTPSAAGTDTLKAVYSGDSNYATTSVSETITVTAAASKPGIPAHPVGPIRSHGGIQGLQVP